MLTLRSLRRSGPRLGIAQNALKTGVADETVMRSLRSLNIVDEEMLKRRNPNSQVLKSAGDALLRSLREEKTSISKQAMMRSLRSYQPNNINDAASMRALRSYKPNIADKAIMRSLRSSDKKKNTEEKMTILRSSPSVRLLSWDPLLEGIIRSL